MSNGLYAPLEYNDKQTSEGTYLFKYVEVKVCTS